MFRKTKICSGLMLAFGGTLALRVSPVFAQHQLERVEITGSSIRRVDAETALPVTIIKVEELTKQGITTAEQALTTETASLKQNVQQSVTKLIESALPDVACKSGSDGATAGHAGNGPGRSASGV